MNKQRDYFVAKIIHENLGEIAFENLTFGNIFTLARIKPVLASNDKYTVFAYSLTGLDKAVNRSQRHNQGDHLIKTASKPAIVVPPIAIFRE